VTAGPDGEDMTAPVTGVLIIRAWVEQGSAQPLRARIRLTRDIASGVERSLALARADAVCREVRDWLDQMLAAASDDRWPRPPPHTLCDIP
jgi:hypothetical protein